MNVRYGVAELETTEGEEVQLPVIELVLSERNLKTLLLNIDDEQNSVTRMTDAGTLLIIRAEPNDVHYAERTAGLMDEQTEAKLLADEFDTDEPLVIPPNFGENLN